MRRTITESGLSGYIAPYAATEIIFKFCLASYMLNWACQPVEHWPLLRLLNLIPTHLVNVCHPGQHGCHFADTIFRCIFMNEKFCIAVQTSLKFVPKGLLDNNPALIQVTGIA